MNPKQFITPKDLMAVEVFLNDNLIGGGVQEVFIPEYRGPFQVPSMGDALFFHVRLKNEAVVNAGLTFDLITRYPAWAVSILRANVQG